jgi:methionyl aminopeptidase
MKKDKIIIKTPEQIDGIRRSCKLAAETLRFIQEYVKEGISTSQLDQLIETFIRDHKAIPAPLNYLGYPKSCCVSVNEVICHGVPNEYRLKEGDILNIDVTTILNGYYGDTATMYSIGKISQDAEDILRVAKKCLDIGIKQVRPNNYFGNIGYEISKYAFLQCCSIVESFCGHGTGLEFHEMPQVVHIAEKNSGDIMLPGMIFTIEPMVNLNGPDAVIDENDGWTARTKDGSLSAQYEHTVLVTDIGCEVLTQSSEPTSSLLERK